jgi:ABC-type bacteriocin/lantibiotic exporter with double-glycine peptidase domain
MQKRLPVPHRVQQADGYCLPACIEMVLANWGTERNQQNLGRQLGTIPNFGTPGSSVLRLSSRQIQANYSQGDLESIQHALANDIPPITLVWTGELPYWQSRTTHAVVITGIEGDFLFLNDPALEQANIRVSVGDFYLAWDEMANHYALLSRT